MKLREVLTVAQLKDFYTIAVEVESRGCMSEEDYKQLWDRVPVVAKRLDHTYRYGEVSKLPCRIKVGYLLGILDYELEGL